MKLPYLFQKVHGDAIFKAWMALDQAPFVRVIPQEPIGIVGTGLGSMPDTCVTTVTVRCWNDRGTLQFEAASHADLQVAKAWSDRHRNTPSEDFEWVLDLART